MFNFGYLTICKYTEKFSFFEVFVKIKNKIVSFPELARVKFNQNSTAKSIDFENITLVNLV